MPLFDVFLTKGFKVEAQNRKVAKEYIYERVAGDFGRSYLLNVGESIRSLRKVKKGI